MPPASFSPPDRVRAIEMAADDDLADLFAVLPHDHLTQPTKMLPSETGRRLHAILSECEVTAQPLLTTDCLAATGDRRAGEVRAEIGASNRESDAISYLALQFYLLFLFVLLVLRFTLFR